MSAQNTPDHDDQRDTAPTPSVSALLASCAAARTVSTPPADLPAESQPAEQQPAPRTTRDAA
jgi:hypothetical protein